MEKKIVYVKLGEVLEIRHEPEKVYEKNYSITIAAKILEISRTSLYKKIENKEIVAERHGLTQKISELEIKKYQLNQNKK